MMSGSRIIYRALKEHQIYGINFKQGKPVFIIGAGTTAISLIKDLSQNHIHHFTPLEITKWSYNVMLFNFLV